VGLEEVELVVQEEEVLLEEEVELVVQEVEVLLEEGVVLVQRLVVHLPEEVQVVEVRVQVEVRLVQLHPLQYRLKHLLVQKPKLFMIMMLRMTKSYLYMLEILLACFKKMIVAGGMVK